MSMYIGERTQNGLYVYVDEDGTKVELDMRTDLRNHSPSGFECGYAGSGPAQLALSLLCHHLRSHDHERRLIERVFERCTLVEATSPYDRAALALYQHFKFKVIAALPSKANWKLASAEVSQAIRELCGSRSLAPAEGSDVSK